MRVRGFTLMELLITMLLLSIVSIGVSSFVTYATRIYADSQAWSESISQYRYGLQRLSRELRDALPGSVSVGADGTSQCVNFRPIVDSGHFIEAPVHNNARQISAFALPCCTGSNCNACDMGQGLAILDGYSVPAILPKVTASSCSSGVCTLTLDQDLIQGDFSVGKRFFVAGNSVSYCLSNTGNLSRTANGATSLMGEGFGNNLGGCDLSDRDNEQCPFTLLPPSLARNNVVKLQFWLTEAGQSQRFAQEVQVENVP